MKFLEVLVLLFCFHLGFAQNQNVIKHKVAKGETITQISKKYSVTPYDIFKLNPDAQKGIDENRLRAKGYGETKLVNQCVDGVKCTEKQHEQNRRSEFIITNL